ncbi:MAG: hypothetical protein WC310_05560 [Patescibacteria group bacterium]|jgi:hypothetical protein
MSKIKVISPKPYEHVGASFILSGQVAKSCLKTNWGSIDDRILGSFVDVDGFEFANTVSADIKHDVCSIFKRKLSFSTTVQFSQFNVPFIVKSQGRIALKLSTHQKHCDLFIPLIVSELEPKGGVDPSIVERQKTIGQRITQYEKDLENYNAERERIGQATTKKEDEIEICDYTERDRLEAELEEKYKDAIKWRGPLFGGPDLLPFVLKTCLELITLWVVKNTLQDLNDALWGKFKQAVKQVFNTKKINPSKKNDIALVIKQAGKKTVVFLFSINLTLDEAEDALTEAKRILASLTDDTLSKETYSPIVFRLNNSEKKWEESSDWMENDIRDGEKVGHVVNIDDKIVGLSPDDYIKKIKSEQSKTPNNGKKDEKESSN